MSFYVGIASAMIEYQGISVSVEVIGSLHLLAYVAYIAVSPLCHYVLQVQKFSFMLFMYCTVCNLARETADLIPVYWDLA